MSWHREATKDVVACDMPREAGKRALIRGFLNEETQLRNPQLLLPECIGQVERTQGTETSQTFVLPQIHPQSQCNKLILLQNVLDAGGGSPKGYQQNHQKLPINPTFSSGPKRWRWKMPELFPFSSGSLPPQSHENCIQNNFL